MAWWIKASLPPGYRIDTGGSVEESAKADQALAKAASTRSRVQPHSSPHMSDGMASHAWIRLLMIS